MPTEQSLTSDIGHIAPVHYKWDAIKWLCNAELMPDCQQSFGYAYVLPGKINPEHQHTTCQEIIYMLAGECDVYMHGAWLHLQPGRARCHATVLRCGKVILVFGLYEDVGQANVATALEPKQAAAR